MNVYVPGRSTGMKLSLRRTLVPMVTLLGKAKQGGFCTEVIKEF